MRKKKRNRKKNPHFIRELNKNHSKCGETQLSLNLVEDPPGTMKHHRNSFLLKEYESVSKGMKLHLVDRLHCQSLNCRT
jgi:hypothetical protein